jgi:hypothetical protein
LEVQNLQGGLAGWRARKELLSQLKSKSYLLAESPLAQGRSGFCSIQAFDWVRPTMKINLLYSNCVDLKPPHRNIQDIVGSNIWAL